MPRRARKWQMIVALAVGVPIIAAGIYDLATPGSSLMNFAEVWLRVEGKPLGDPKAYSDQMLSREGPTEAPVPDALRLKYNVTEAELEGHPVITVAPATGAGRWHMIYTHGGAYVNGVGLAHWEIIDQLIAHTGATVTVPIYPLAPESDNRAAFEFLTAAYRQVLETTAPENIVLVGDSAGAGLVLGQALEYREMGLSLPARLILFSPWLDLTLADPAAKDIEPIDPMLGIEALRLSGKWWAKGDDLKAPRLSPFYADLNGLPPMDLFVGTHDILVIDARSFVQKAKAAGVPLRYFEYAGGVHVFMGAPWIPESQDVYRRIGEALPPS